ncbi:hypothetical protein [Labilibaculum sp.]|uniref:hypothetical protein n=1 Tax=Labilibaculum sp. TaxID=2060723 RepID=UPI0035684E87
MKKILVFCFLALGFSFVTKAQEKALTSKGKVVNLYENGTWEYVEKDNGADSTALHIENSIKSEFIETANSNDSLILKDAEIEKCTFIEGPSEKLKKYFKDRNIVQCNFTLQSKDGVARLTTDWRIMNAEAYSYFGFIKKDSFLRLELLGGTVVDLVFKEEFSPKEFEKYGFSTYSAQLEITKDQLELLKNKIVMKAIMNWSRRAEEYQIVAPSYFIEAIPQITE